MARAPARVLCLALFALAGCDACDSWCEDSPCASLNGDVADECGGCGATAVCHAGAPGFPGAPAHAAPVAAAPEDAAHAYVAAEQVAAAAAAATDVSAADAPISCPVQHVSAASFRAHSAVQRAELLRTPTVLTGLIDGWRALTALADADAARAALGHLRLRANRTGFGRREHGPTEGEVSFAELLSHTGSEHIVVFSDWGTDEARAIDSALHGELFTVPPELVRAGGNEAIGGRHASDTRIYSFGGGTTGVHMSHHGFSWMGVVAGAKRWYVAPPTLPKRREPQCARRAEADEAEGLDGVITCLHLPGQVFVLPESWWHATCNVLPHTIGLGGQDGILVDGGYPRADPALGHVAAHGSKPVDWYIAPMPGLDELEGRPGARAAKDEV